MSSAVLATERLLNADSLFLMKDPDSKAMDFETFPICRTVGQMQSARRLSRKARFRDLATRAAKTLAPSNQLTLGHGLLAALSVSPAVLCDSLKRVAGF